MLGYSKSKSWKIHMQVVVAVALSSKRALVISWWACPLSVQTNSQLVLTCACMQIHVHVHVHVAPGYIHCTHLIAVLLPVCHILDSPVAHTSPRHATLSWPIAKFRSGWGSSFYVGLLFLGTGMTAGRGISPLAPISGDWTYGSEAACNLSCGLAVFEVRWEHLFLFTCLWPLAWTPWLPCSSTSGLPLSGGENGPKPKCHEEK